MRFGPDVMERKRVWPGTREQMFQAFLPFSENAFSLSWFIGIHGFFYTGGVTERERVLTGTRSNTNATVSSISLLFSRKRVFVVLIRLHPRIFLHRCCDRTRTSFNRNAFQGTRMHTSSILLETSVVIRFQRSLNSSIFSWMFTTPGESSSRFSATLSAAVLKVPNVACSASISCSIACNLV